MDTHDTCRVYVGNLLPKAKEVDLTSKFARFGTIHSVWIARRPPGFAFVWFATPDEAQRAVETSGDGQMEILGKTVRVQMAGEKTKQIECRKKRLKRNTEFDREQRPRCRREKTTKTFDGRKEERDRSRSRNRQSTRCRRLRSSYRESCYCSRYADRSRLRSELRQTRSSSRSRVRQRRSSSCNQKSGFHKNEKKVAAELK